MPPLTLTKQQAKKIILHAAGLSKHAQFGKGREAAYKVIDHLGFVQIDTNYVVERAHHHALAARVPGYKTEWLDQLQTDARIFESWTYAAGYAPMDEFRFSLPVRASLAQRRKEQTQAEINLMNKVLDRIGREGPLMASNFENDRVTKSSGWWDWRPSKVALEHLNFDGRLMTLRTKNFLKVYDLPGNVIPSGIDTTTPTSEEYARHVIMRSLKALGVASFKDIVFRARYIKEKKFIKAELENMVRDQEVYEIEVKGIKDAPLYMLAEYKSKKISISGDVYILSPFDVLNVYRHRLQTFFDFDYMVECFVPSPKRKYGYFSLPILLGDTFIARMDSKADRKKRMLTIHNLHFESVKLSNPLIAKLCDAISTFAKFNKCNAIVLKKSNDKVLLKVIQNSVA